jgi:hypothetical protein
MCGCDQNYSSKKKSMRKKSRVLSRKRKSPINDKYKNYSKNIKIKKSIRKISKRSSRKIK